MKNGCKIDVIWLSRKIKNPSINEIILQLTDLINSGEIKSGSILPSVRELAKELGVSPATVSTAWKTLRTHQMVSGMGRQGITVIGNAVAPIPSRFTEMTESDSSILINLNYSTPDPKLLPNLHEALNHAIKVKNLNGYQRTPIIDSLKNAVLPTWPYQPEAFIATNTDFEAIIFILKMIVMPVSFVAIEDPTSIRLLDILDELKIKVISVPCDSEGPIPEKLEEALAQKPVAFIYQPNTHTPCGHTVSKKRIKQMAKIFNSSSTLILEHDLLGDLASNTPQSLGKFLPQQTVHIRAYCKSYGPDLRISVVSAADTIIQQIQHSRNFSVGWTSRILQQALAWLINDPDTQKKIKQARKIYADRHRALINSLKKRRINLSYSSHDGLGLWLEVPSEDEALESLKNKGIVVTPGRYSSIQNIPHIRVGTSLLTNDIIDSVADALALVLKKRNRARFNFNYF